MLIGLSTFAQNKQGKVPYMTKSNIDKYVVVDTASVRVWYALNALDIEDEDTYLDLQRFTANRGPGKTGHQTDAIGLRPIRPAFAAMP